MKTSVKTFVKENILYDELGRVTEGGWGGGYVVIPKEHPLYGKDCDEIHDLVPNLKVHGGLTFADAASYLDLLWDELPEGSEESWVIGFHTQNPGDTLARWNKGAVIRETHKLKWQIVEYTHNLVEQYMNTIVDTTILENYMQDGADPQAKAVLAFLQQCVKGYVENQDSKSRYFMWDGQHKIKIARWKNSREQGYVVSLTNSKDKQLNIAFFEHRDSDNLCSTKWYQNMEIVTVEDSDFGTETETDGDTKINYDLSHSVDYGKAYEMAVWIAEELVKHWERG